MLGAAYSLSITASDRLLRRSVNEGDWRAVFAAQFALSQACWLIAYPIARYLGASLGQHAALTGLGLLSATGFVLGLVLWPRADPEFVLHCHDGLLLDHEHISTMDSTNVRGRAFVIDDLLLQWPKV